MDTNRTFRTNKSRPNQNLSINKDAGGELRSNKRLTSIRRSGGRLCDKGDDGRDETPVSQDHSGETTETRRTKLKPIKNNSLHDLSGIYYSSNTLYIVKNFLPSEYWAETDLEITYLRVLQINKLIHTLYVKAERKNSMEDMMNLRAQQAIVIEVLRILKQQILIERGGDKNIIQQQEDERIWERKLW